MPELGTVGADRGSAGPPATIGVGMLGYAFMGRAHVNAYRTLAYMATELPLSPRLVAIAGRNEQAVHDAARRFGFERAETDWRALIADDSIELFDNGGPNALHAEPTIAAAEAGKHVICEKPLGRTAEEAHEIWRRVQATGVKAMCAFNYRFVPAVRLARRLIEAGELGEIYHFRGRYLQDWIADPEFPMVWRLSKEASGSGALGDLGAHVIDLARYLVGEITTIAGTARTFIEDRPGGHVDVDDAVEGVVGFEGGAVGTLEATRFAVGRKNGLAFEINGSKGSIAFDLERLNELSVHLSGSRPGAQAQGFRQVLVTEADHPYMDMWWPPGHIIGWEHTFSHELLHLLSAIATGAPVGPDGATLQDGYRAAEVCDALLRASETGQRQTLSYRDAQS
ncbi:MAG TPA: Gfo/Idh/MocA family oxidoreductase [Solirubrobacteraceae bacterium]|nr:Gfo/Idh/MocA family oxidoreductase [Solirubrobacteraceae bacterium]